MTFFSAEDFEAMDVWHPATLAWHCNQKLQREAKVVYFSQQFPHIINHDRPPLKHYDTHRALLVCIEPLEKPKCEHEPSKTKYIDPYLYDKEKGFANVDMENNICGKCGVKLKAKWEVVDEQR